MVTSSASTRPSPERIFNALTAYQQSAALKAGVDLDPEDAPARDTTFIYILGSSQPGRGKKELGRDVGRPGVSRDREIRAGRQAGGKSGRDVNASVELFADGLVPDITSFDYHDRIQRRRKSDSQLVLSTGGCARNTERPPPHRSYDRRDLLGLRVVASGRHGPIFLVSRVCFT